MANQPLTERMSRLALSFPSVARMVESGMLPGIAPWNASKFHDFMGNPGFRLGSGANASLAFISHVWGCGSHRHAFDLRNAFARWDEAHRAAFKAWASDPWWA